MRPTELPARSRIRQVRRQPDPERTKLRRKVQVQNKCQHSTGPELLHRPRDVGPRGRHHCSLPALLLRLSTRERRRNGNQPTPWALLPGTPIYGFRSHGALAAMLFLCPGGIYLVSPLPTRI